MFSQTLRRSTAVLRPPQSLQEVLLKLDARIADLADLNVAADLLLGHALELTVQVFKEPGASLLSGDHRDGSCTGRGIGPGRIRAAGPAILAGATEQSFQRFQERHLIFSRVRDLSHLKGIVRKSALELPASTKKTTLYGSDRDSHDLGDLPVRKILQA